MVVKSTVVITEKAGKSVHDVEIADIQNNDYTGLYECTKCSKVYYTLYESAYIPCTHKKRCHCGSTGFTAHQQCYNDVIVDSNNIFQADLGCYESEKPYGLYCCIECGGVYEDLGELEDIVENGVSNESNPVKSNISALVDEIGMRIKVLEKSKSGLDALNRRLPNNISIIEREVRKLQKDYKDELEKFIHLYMEERCGIKDRHDANNAYIVFDAKARYVKVYR